MQIYLETLPSILLPFEFEFDGGRQLLISTKGKATLALLVSLSLCREWLMHLTRSSSLIWKIDQPTRMPKCGRPQVCGRLSLLRNSRVPLPHMQLIICPGPEIPQGTDTKAQHVLWRCIHSGTPVLPFTALGKSVNFEEPQFSGLQNGSTHSFLMHLLWGLRASMLCMKC